MMSFGAAETLVYSDGSKILNCGKGNLKKNENREDPDGFSLFFYFEVNECPGGEIK